MKFAHKIYLAIALALAVGGLFFRADHMTGHLLADHASTLNTLGEMQRLEGALDRQLMQAAFQLYHEYDSMHRLLAGIRAHAEGLQGSPSLQQKAFAGVRQLLDRYQAQIDEKEQRILEFATLNSVIKNSTTHIPALSHRYLSGFDTIDQAYLAEVARVTSVVFIAARSFDDDFLRELSASIERLRGFSFDESQARAREFNAMFLAHAGVFVRYLPRYKAVSEQIRAIASGATLDLAKTRFLAASERTAARIQRIGWGLAAAFVFSIGLIIFFLVFMERQHKELAALHRSFQRAATQDRLTGLYTRFAFERAQQVEIPQQALFLINLDNFIRINDFYGHAAGDGLLRHCAAALRTRFGRESDLELFRLGGDEFGILCRGLRGDRYAVVKDQVVGFAAGLRFSFRDHAIPVETSIAISTEPPLLEKAGLALRQIEHTRTRLVEYRREAGMEAQVEQNLRMLNLLHGAIRDDRVLPYFQPILNNHTGRIEKYECLVRVHDEDGNLLPPGWFLAVAKQARLYGELTCIMLRKCFERFRHTHLEFHINISVEDIQDPKVTAVLHQLLQAEPQTGERLTLEILESEEVANYEAVHGFICGVKRYGCKLALDDFGAGYSNLAQVLRLDVDNIKLDASLVRDIVQNPDLEFLMRSLLEMFRAVNIQAVTAEFVHSAEVLEKVKTLGVDYAQGYYIGKPKPDLVDRPFQGQEAV